MFNRCLEIRGIQQLKVSAIPEWAAAIIDNQRSICRDVFLHYPNGVASIVLSDSLVKDPLILNSIANKNVDAGSQLKLALSSTDRELFAATLEMYLDRRELDIFSTTLPNSLSWQIRRLALRSATCEIRETCVEDLPSALYCYHVGSCSSTDLRQLILNSIPADNLGQYSADILALRRYISSFGLR